MSLYEELMGKNAIATVKVSRELIKYSLGDKIPTVSEFVDSLKLARGTVQNALKTLVDHEAIRLESRGHLGSYLVKKNIKILLRFAGIDSLLGAMPLPYSKRYEGLASGLIVAMENNYELPINLAYMRGSKNRISMVLQKRYDFAIVSKYAADMFTQNYPDEKIEIVMDFGPRSYLNSHVIMFHDQNEKEIKDHMKIGIDSTSVDQSALVKEVCKGKDVEFVEIEYSRILDRIVAGDIDATVMNGDEAKEKHVRIKMVEIENMQDENTRAAIVISKDNDILAYLLRELLDINTVLNIQKLVIDEKITPSY